MFNIDVLARRCGVTRRAVRFYIQRGLVEPPDGAGRGSYYTERHVAQIKGVLKLSGRGVPLGLMKRSADGLEAEEVPDAEKEAPDAVVKHPTAMEQVGQVARILLGLPDPPISWKRFVVADGLEVHVREGAVPSGKLAGLLEIIRGYANNNMGA